MAFRPLISSNSFTQNLGQVNDMVRTLNNEQQVKIFKGPNNTNALTIGKVYEDDYGILSQASDGNRRIFLGTNPADGEPVLAISISGTDVIDELLA